MTREEAITILKEGKLFRMWDTQEQDEEALRMAIETLSAEHKHCWECKHYEPKYNVCHAPELVKQVTSKLKSVEISTDKGDKSTMSQPNGKLESADVAPKIDHDREWIIGCIKHDGFIKTDRFDKANQIILDALDDRPKVNAKLRADWLKRQYEIVIEENKRLKADRPSGTWEHWGSPFSDESEVVDTIVCSVCGARFIEPKDEPKGEYNYCPSCGARMENTK